MWKHTRKITKRVMFPKEVKKNKVQRVVFPPLLQRISTLGNCAFTKKNKI